MAGSIFQALFSGNSAAENTSTPQLGANATVNFVAQTANSELIGLNGNASNTVLGTNMNSNGNTGNSLYNFNDVVKVLKTSGLFKM